MQTAQGVRIKSIAYFWAHRGWSDSNRRNYLSSENMYRRVMEWDVSVRLDAKWIRQLSGA